MHQHGNNFTEHDRAGQPPMLRFDCKFLLDLRKVKQSVSYSLSQIIPTDRLPVDLQRRLSMIIAPRAENGPGVRDFKE